MSKNIVGRHYDLSDSIRDHISESLDSLDKYNLNIISSNTIITADSKTKKNVSVELVLNLKDKNTIVITQSDKDVYTAADTAFSPDRNFATPKFSKTSAAVFISFEFSRITACGLHVDTPNFHICA